MTNNYYLLMMGFSLAMGAAISLVGVLLLFVGYSGEKDVRLVRRAGAVGLAASMGLLAISASVIRLLPPVMTFGLATLAFAMHSCRRR